MLSPAAITARLAQHGLPSELVSGAAWHTTAVIVARAAAAAASVAAARALGIAGYGELAVVQTTLTACGVAASFGLGATVTKRVSEALNRDGDAAGRAVASCAGAAVVTGGLTSLFLITAAPWLAHDVLHRPDLVTALRIASPAVLTGTLQSVFLSALLAIGELRLAARIMALSGLVAGIFLAIGALALGLRGAVAGIACSSVLEVLGTLIVARRSLRRHAIVPRFSATSSDWRTLWGFSLPLHAANMLMTPTLWLCQAIVAREPNGYRELGLFNAASQWRTVAYVIPGVLASLSTPLLASRWEYGRHAEAVRLARRIVVVALVAIASVGAILTPSAGFIMAAYGPAFRKGAILIPTLMVAAAFTAVGHIASQLLIARGRVAILPVAAALWALAATGLTHAWRPRGAIGLAFALVTAYALHAAMIALAAFRRQDLSLDPRSNSEHRL